jgi:N-acetylmuramic acid 6-phosphate etherase
MNEVNFKQKALDFLKVSSQFQLGHLPTEKQHTQTQKLSDWSITDLPKALDTIKEIDLALFDVLEKNIDQIIQMSNDIKKTFKNNGRVYFCGCGATGRLSLAIETIWRKENPNDDRVRSFMAGGDVALISSIEKFEDYPEFGSRQLRESGFSKNDLLISCTEGGETPFVIGATEEAEKSFETNPYFLYCNPDEELIEKIERSKKVIENKKIHKINLAVGPMVLAGSTRMQASTILMLAAGIALFASKEDSAFLKNELSNCKTLLSQTDFTKLIPFIETEAKAYEDKGHVFYQAEGSLGISILTDTTERAPTFSLKPFEDINDLGGDKSLCYLLFEHQNNSEVAWEELLERRPRCFQWEEFGNRTSYEKILGFDFSNNIKKHRLNTIGGNEYTFKITNEESSLSFELEEAKAEFNMNEASLFIRHIILKILLNTHSTLLMGRLGRYQSNIMTWVRPSNYKLIDRSIRYALILLNEQGIEVTYEMLAHRLFKILENLNRDEAIVQILVKEFTEEALKN